MGKKFRYRVKSSYTPTNIPRGGSSSSNPVSNRFREAAKAAKLIRNYPLIAVDDRISGNDQILSQLPIHVMDLSSTNENKSDDNFSMSSFGNATDVSRFTKCTNPTFNPVHREWMSGSKIQDDVVAVLAAVTETIQQDQGSESDAEYYGALLSTLNSTSNDEPKKIAAIGYLLTLTMKKLPKEIRIKFFSQTTKILIEKLEAVSSQESEEAHAALKFLLAAIGLSLQVQPPSIWEFQINKSLLTGLTSFVLHEKPWVRKTSRHSLINILTDPVSCLSNGIHPASKIVGQQIIYLIKSEAEHNDASKLSSIFHLLSDILHKMPESIFIEICEMLLHFSISTNMQIASSALRCLSQIFMHQPLEATMSTDTLIQIIRNLRELDFASIGICAYWIQALVDAHICFTSRADAKSVDLLPETLHLFQKLFHQGDETFARSLFLSISRLIHHCIQQNSQASVQCLEMLDKCLNIQNTRVWPYVLEAISTLYEESKNAVLGEVFSRVMNTLATIREHDDCFCKDDVDKVFASAIRHIGIVDILDHVPLDIDPDLAVLPLDFKRSWLLSLLETNIKNAPLSFFVKYFLPLSLKLHRRLPTLGSLRRKLYSSIESKLWELLPRFLRSPSDFEEFFPTLAPITGSALLERPDLRMALLSSIRCAISFAEEPDANIPRRQLIAQYAKNYLPILFNIYSSDEPLKVVGYDDKAVKASTLETIRRYVIHTPTELLQQYADSAAGKISQSEMDFTKKGRIADLILMFIQRLDSAMLEKILNEINGWFKEAKWQKKAYRMLNEMYKRIHEENLQGFFTSTQEFIGGMVQFDVKKVTKNALLFRIGVFRSILTSITDYNLLLDYCNEITKDVIFCLDSSLGMRTRTQSTKCLHEMCDSLIQLGSQVEISPSDALENVLKIILISITPSPGSSLDQIPLSSMKSNLIALNIFTQKEVKLLNASLLNKLINGVCSAISDHRPDVRVLVLRLLRVLCQRLPEFALQQYKEMLIRTIFSQSLVDNSVRMRKYNRILLEVLLEKFSREFLERFIENPIWHILVRNAEKKLNKRQRKAVSEQEGQNEDDAVSRVTSHVTTTKTDVLFDLLDSEEDDEDKAPRIKDAKSIVLKEGGEDDLVEMLDRDSVIHNTAMSTISKTINYRKESVKKSYQELFKLTKDGRLIIRDEPEVKKPKKKILDDSDEGDQENMPTKAKSRIDTDDEDSDMETRVSSKYMPGGKGIHRKLNQKTSDHKKKGEKFEPYAYIPLRKQANEKKGAIKEILKKHKRKRLSGINSMGGKVSKRNKSRR